MKTHRVLLAAVLFATVIVGPSRLPGCGPFFPEAIFTPRVHPAQPLDEYLRGSLGVLQPTYARKYLFAAYRTLTNRPLSTAEREAIRAGPAPGLDPSARLSQVIESYPGVTAWQDARGRVSGAGEAPDIEVFRKLPGDDWQRFPNCLDNAFQTSANTLAERIRAFGAGHAGVNRGLTTTTY